MREERVTINIISWLEANDWQIVCYDFPQSGTGVLLHPNSTEKAEKNKGAIIPDIIAARDSIAVFFENKDRFVISDFNKIREIKLLGKYLDSLNAILDGFSVINIFYGIGFPAKERDIIKSLENIDEIDFLVCTYEDGKVQIIHDEFGIFS